MNHGNKVLAAAAAMMLMAALAGCGQGVPSATPATTAPAPVVTATPSPTPEPTPSPTPTPPPVVTIRSLFPGEQPAGLPAVFTVLNERLAQDVYANLELSWAPADGFADAIASAVSARTVDFLRFESSRLSDFTTKQLLAPLDGPMAEFGGPIYDSIGQTVIDTMKRNGALMAIPGAGNMPLCDTGHVLVVRDDLRQKYELPALDSFAAVEQYLATIKAKEPGIVPIAAGNAATVIMKAFGPEEFLPGTNNAVAYKINDDGTVTCVNIQDAASFRGAAIRVRAWYKADLLPKEVMAIKDTGAMLTAGTSAAAGGTALSSIALQSKAQQKYPDAVLAEVPLFGADKYITSDGGIALGLAAGSPNGGTVVQFWAWVLSEQDNYDLLRYGVEHVNFELSDGGIKILDDSYSKFPVVFDSINFRRFPSGVSDGAVAAYQHWNDGAKVSPLLGFVFNPAPVKAELAKVKAVYAAYSPALNTGSADTSLLLKEFAARMKAAGQAKVLAEAQKQVDAFLSMGK